MIEQTHSQYHQCDDTRPPVQPSQSQAVDQLIQHDNGNIISRCLAFLDYPNLLQAAQTNRSLNQVTQRDSLWSSINQNRVIPLPTLASRRATQEHEQTRLAMPHSLSRIAAEASAYSVRVPLNINGTRWANIDDFNRLQLFTFDTDNQLQVIPQDVLLNHRANADAVQVTALCKWADSTTTGTAFVAALSDGSTVLIDPSQIEHPDNRPNRQPIIQPIVNLAEGNDEITAMCMLPHRRESSLWLVLNENTLMRGLLDTTPSQPHHRNALSYEGLETVYQCETGNFIHALASVGPHHIVLGLADGSVDILKVEEAGQPPVISRVHYDDLDDDLGNKIPGDDSVTQVVTYDERYFVSTHQNGRLVLRDINHFDRPRKSGYCESPTTAITFDRTRSIMITGHEDGILRFWDFGGAGHLFKPQAAPIKPHLGVPIDFVSHHDHNLITASAGEATIKKWTFNIDL